MPSFITLPPELIEELILNLDPTDIAHLTRTSRHFHTLIYGAHDGDRLWRLLYLQQPLDDPRRCVSLLGFPRTAVTRREGDVLVDVDWKGDLQRFVAARSVLYKYPIQDSGNTKEKEEEENQWGWRYAGERLATLRTVVELMTCVPPFREVSKNIRWVYAAPRLAALLDDIAVVSADGAGGSGELGEEEKQLAGRLHLYFGLTPLDMTRATRTRSRGVVYDLRRYTPGNAFGPFRDSDGGSGGSGSGSSGRVNWVHVQALYHVIVMHLVEMQKEASVEGMILPMALPVSKNAFMFFDSVVEREPEDWAGVAGEWRVSFCFCDHTDLMKYNMSGDTGGLLDTSVFSDPEFGEVFRSLDFTLRVTSVRLNKDFPTRPIIYFVGEMEEGFATIKGQVTVRQDGEIQWYFLSSGDNDHFVWSSQGIQIGGIRSSFGVLGAWTTTFHDPDDPVGPFWLRKKWVTEGLPMDHVSQNLVDRMNDLF